ncbi:uncharacterized protein GGS25DRAFT_501477 [Hypoxylon fragiforme]|uniref:uncharacterized protein n=1 Tax=Hypoxylon fragiforme TaxID=63214 RepID=UPI0020C6F312|nr:uncharacterized protein GGS25DRAFT_501477 [Hypoxylon fragiforme]KAI2606481.1 hypothetical protein GGS25DRAFT_501477 [Hypoxylon fragiforme]
MDGDNTTSSPSIDPIDISNGTCFYAIDSPAKKDYIPCGNIAVGVDWACCVAGDICLGSRACYHYHFDITYVAGCTDPKFGSPNCPHKGQFSSQQWAGLQRCDPDDSIWAGCPDTGDIPGLKPPAKCTCDPASELFTDKPKLDNIALLPTSSGGSISWYPGMRPTIDRAGNSTPAPTSTGPSTASGSTVPSTSSYPGSPIVASPDTPSPSTVPTTTGSTLSVATQAGIGLGVGFGAVLLGCLVYLGLLLRKRKNMRQQGNPFLIGDASSPPYPHQTPSSEFQRDVLQNGLLIAATPPPPQPGGLGHAYGFKPELPADEPKRASPAATAPSQLHPPQPPSVPATAPAPLSGPMAQSHAPRHGSTQLPQSPSSQQRQFKAYNPLLHGDYAGQRASSSNSIGNNDTSNVTNNHNNNNKKKSENENENENSENNEAKEKDEKGVGGLQVAGTNAGSPLISPLSPRSPMGFPSSSLRASDGGGGGGGGIERAEPSPVSPAAPPSL